MTRQPIPIQSMTDQDGKPVGTAFLMPAREGTCETCATAHEPELPHNAQSLFYQTRFNIEHGRPATWTDAMAHCTSELQSLWRAKLIELGVDVDSGKIHPARKAKKVQPAASGFSCPFWQGQTEHCAKSGGCTYDAKTGKCA